MSGQTDDAMPYPREVVLPIVEPHLSRFAGAMMDAWSTFVEVRTAAPSQMGQAGAGARGILIADFLRRPVHRRFTATPGAVVDDRYGRPWVNLAGGLVQVRFRKLTPTLQICPSDTQRQTALAFHLGDPYLPGMPEATILTAGYVVDAADQQIERMALVCHLGSEVHHFVNVPGGVAESDPVTQLPLTPLSPPIIRSAREAARERLDRGQESG
ncbi:hypothetical protein [Mycolicibacterium fortuitum]|uniref:hypothetical protein n=1 Tax=Mycolicibacterium fortuitum TaxID=1766 RepID=UPI001490350C|nr:hypothetical protein [Mycolicibacterium fortuitum]